jgi:hypothetical protein
MSSPLLPRMAGGAAGVKSFSNSFQKHQLVFKMVENMYFQIIQQNNPMLQHVCQISSFVKTMLKTFCVLSKSLEIVQGMFWTFVDL